MNNEIEQLRAELARSQAAHREAQVKVNQLYAELRNAYTAMNMETVERAIKTVYRGVQGLHGAILRTDADMSAIRGRMQEPWFTLFQQHRNALRRVVGCYRPGDPIREEILREFPKLLGPEGETTTGIEREEGKPRREMTGDMQRRESDIAHVLMEKAKLAFGSVTPGFEARTAEEWGGSGFEVDLIRNGVHYCYRIAVEERVMPEEGE